MEVGKGRKRLADALQLTLVGLFLATGSASAQGTLSGTVTSQQTG